MANVMTVSDKIRMPRIKSDREIQMEQAKVSNVQQRNAMAQAEFDEYQANAPARNKMAQAQQMKDEEFLGGAEQRQLDQQRANTAAGMGQDKDAMSWEYGQLSQVNDEAGWDRYTANREKMGFDSTHLPDSYNPELVSTALEGLEKGLGTAGGVTAREKLDQQILEEEGRQGRYEGLKGSQQLDYIGEAEELKAERKTVGKLRGEDIDKLASLEAGMPGLTEVADKLAALSEVATFTKVGMARDAAARQMGKSTEGAEARAEFIATIDNEVLPLLRQTFGAAFTVPEGDALRATMGDPNLTPQERKAQLVAFIEGKQREVAKLKAKVGSQPQQEYTEGQIAIQNGNRFQYQNGKWVQL